MNPRHLPQTDIYAVLSSAHSRGRPNIEVARQLLEAGVKIIQYREKALPMRQKYAECLAIRELCRRHDACFIVNDDAGLAVAVGAGGLHLGQDDLPPAAARKIIGEEMILGLSVTTPGEVDETAGLSTIDYLGVGPIFDATPTKPDAATPGGLALLDYCLSHSDLPVVAIGGIRLANVAELTRRGAMCLAMVSDLVGAEDLKQRVSQIRDAIATAGSA